MPNKVFIEPAREIPVIETDVLVAGAGTAGCVAAVAAARAGARVVLVEKMPAPSGTFTNGGNAFSSLYAQARFDDDVRQIVRGLPEEILQRCVAYKGLEYYQYNDPHRAPIRARFNHEVVKGVLCEMLAEAGVKVLLQTFLCGAKTENGVIEAAIIENKDGRFAVEARQYIDCTGDGDLAKYCGAEQRPIWQHYNKMSGAATSMPMSMCNIDLMKAATELPEVFRFFSGEKPHTDPDGTYHGGLFFLTVSKDTEGCEGLKSLGLREFCSFYSTHPGHVYINNSKGVQDDCSNAETLSNAEMTMRIKNVKMAKALIEEVPGFEHAYIDWQAMMLGIRASKVTVCDKMLTQEEITAGTRFDDEVGLFGYNDYATTHRHSELLIQSEDGVYGVPYRMILPVGIKNLYMAGRCVTEEPTAHMSTRNTVSCMVMGQAAGVASALCARQGCMSRELPYSTLRQALLSQDVVLDI